ncbi:MAG: prepilin-type N-terminal cleavage/methylation domain-containing protein [Lysobacterales bacterium]
MRKPLHRQRGFSMIEMLVAIVIFSIGMIGVALMQLRGMSYAKDAGSRTQSGRSSPERWRTACAPPCKASAAVLGNVDWMEQVDYRYPGGAVATACSSRPLSSRPQITMCAWITQQVLQKLPPPASGQAVTITRATAPSQMHKAATSRWKNPMATRPTTSSTINVRAAT